MHAVGWWGRQSPEYLGHAPNLSWAGCTLVPDFLLCGMQLRSGFCWIHLSCAGERAQTTRHDAHITQSSTCTDRPFDNHRTVQHRLVSSFSHLPTSFILTRIFPPCHRGSCLFVSQGQAAGFHIPFDTCPRRSSPDLGWWKQSGTSCTRLLLLN